MKVLDILKNKGSEVISVTGDTTVLNALKILNEKNMSFCHFEFVVKLVNSGQIYRSDQSYKFPGNFTIISYSH